MDERFLAFRRMITPIIIQVLFWIGVIFCVIGAIGMMTRGGWAVLGGFIALILGPLCVRVYCELLIVIFRINESLTDIRNKTAA